MLINTLDEHPQIFCAGEILKSLNPKALQIRHPECSFYQYLSESPFKKWAHRYRIKRYVTPFLKQFYQPKGARGFKIMLNQLQKYPEVLKFIQKENIFVVILKRQHILKRFISHERAKATGTWATKKDIKKEDVRLKINTNQLLKNLKNYQLENEELDAFAQQFSGLSIAYENLIQPSQFSNELSTIQQALQVTEHPLQPATKKIISGNGYDLVTNLQEVIRTLEGSVYAKYTKELNIN